MDGMWVGMTWLHAAGIVAVLGPYAVLAVVLLPALRGSLEGEQLGLTIASFARRSRLLLVPGVAMLLVSGVYLMVTAGRYGGVGNLFATTWTVLLTVKHMVVLVMVALGIAIDWLARSIGAETDDGARRTLVGVLGLAAEGMTVLGAIVLLLTAAAQVS